MRAKKSLGQHFLRSPQVLEAMCQAGKVTAGDTILEIGAGTGTLTGVLLQKGAHVVALEKDQRLIPELRKQFQKELETGQLKLVETDVLAFDPREITETGPAQSYKIVANIPYYITGAILEKFLGGEFQPSLMALLVQKEVAQRIVANDGKESILSISVKCYGQARIVQKVSRRLFSPPPKVDSAILLITDVSKRFFNTENGESISEDRFFEVIRGGFAHKRKKLKNNLLLLENISPETLSAAMEKAGLHENTRAEEVTLEQWKILAHSLEL